MVYLLHVKELVDSLYGLLSALLGCERVFEIEEIKPFIAKFLVVLANKLGLHKRLFVRKCRCKAFAFGLDDNYFVDLVRFVTAEQKEVRHILTNIIPSCAVFLVAVNFELGKCVVTVEIEFKRFAMNERQYLRGEIIYLQLTIKAIRQIVVRLIAFRVRI